MTPIRRNDRVTIEKKVDARNPEYGTQVEQWEIVADHIWANVQDALPSRAERTSNNLATTTQSTRLRVMKSHMITPAMRVTLHGRFGDRVMQVISGPALMDDRLHNEFMLEGYSHG
jgi:head-tail adaptor